MKTLSAKQIEQIKSIQIWDSTKIHGNTKKVGELPVAYFKSIVAKKYNRKIGNYVLKNGKVIFNYQFKTSKKSNVQKVRELIKWSLECADTNYFKILIEGNTGIYYASPNYGHSDYNKSRIFSKNTETLKLMQIFNSIVSKKISKSCNI